MPATVRLVLSPPGADRTPRLLAAYRAAVADAPGSALVLLPTRRHADALRGQLLAGGSTSRLLPHVHDLQGFADELVRANNPALRPLSGLQRRLLLDGVISELRDAGELGPFAAVADTRGFADAAAGAVAELKAARADLRQLLKVSGRREGANAEPFHAAVRVFDRYHRKLAKLHRLDPDDRLGRAAELWAADRRGPFAAVRTGLLDGFTTFTASQQHLLDVLRGSVDHLWLGLAHEEGETPDKAFAAPQGIKAWAASRVGPTTLFNPAPDVEADTLPADESRAHGLGCLARTLFRGSDTTPPPDAAGLHLIEAPGAVGEARLIARAVRRHLADGVPADRVLVVARTCDAGGLELIREVFDEYAVPHAPPDGEPLARVPAVAFLLRAWRLPENDWAFPEVAAVLRSGFFRPAWPEVARDPDVATKAEALLRMLGEPRSREAYLTAVRIWEHTPPAALEDESAEEPRRKRVQRLAGRCRAFLERFFRTWDRLKPAGSPESFVAWLRTFADDIGLNRAAKADPREAAGLARFWQELDRWARADHPAVAGRKPLPAARIARALSALAAVPCVGRTSNPAGRVKVLPAERAVGLPCDVLFLVGLGEGSWPRLAAPDSLLDDGERERLRKAGFGVPDPAARLGTEQLLFLRLASEPRRELVLSYAAVDEKGQTLLPSTFLRDVRACFAPDAIPITRQRMLIEGYLSHDPVSASESRSQVAQGMADGPRGGPPGAVEGLSPDLLANLHAARAAADARFRSHLFGPHDGEMRHPAVAADLAARFGPERVFSPTALEAYVACPFRFWLEHVLRLDPLEDPAEEVEHTRRGSAFHRALARLHRWINETVPHALAGADVPEAVGDELLKRIEHAVEEYAARAPSVASRELWRLEGQRLLRSAARYRDHWHAFRKPWHEKASTPRPFAFEAEFGVAAREPGAVASEPLVLTVGDVEVRIGGVIDRVDVADLGADGVGFWVIDYKTGRAANYSAAQVERFEKLQLPLYAMAVERVLLKGKPARPLGLAYWLVTDTGTKLMMPAKRGQPHQWLTDPDRWPRFRAQVEAWVADLVGRVRAGDFPLSPRADDCTDRCGFGPVCRVAQARGGGKPLPLALPLLPTEPPAND